MTKARDLLDDKGLRRVLQLLNGNGEEARVVGGAVRNALLDRAATDFDIATTAAPDIVMSRATEAGLRTIPTGLAHGTVTLRVEGQNFEVTTLREDVETDGRHAKVRFGRDFSRDALRRDFTLNAMSMDIDGEIHDYAGGLGDIAAGRVRFIGDPRSRIQEDYLRILRFFRFSAEFATGQLDADALIACVREREGLARLSRERVRQEILKLVGASRAVFAAGEMADAGLLGLLLGTVPQPARLKRLIAIEPDSGSLLRIAALSVVVREDAERLRDRLRLSNAETLLLTKAAAAVAAFRSDTGLSRGHLRQRLFEDGSDAALKNFYLAWAESRAQADDPVWRSAATFLRDTPEPRLPFSGQDLLARGVASGKPLGLILKRLQADWIRAGFPQDPRRLSQLLDEVTRS